MYRFACCAGLALVIAASASAAPAKKHREAVPELPTDCSTAAIPDEPAHGHVGGKDFALGGATLLETGASAGGVDYDNYLLTLEAPDGAGATLTIVVTASVPKGQLLDSKTFRRIADDDLNKQPLAGPGEPQIPDWGIDYASPLVDLDSASDLATIRLEFGARAGTKLPAKIYFCAPDAKTNVFAGTFTVDTSG